MKNILIISLLLASVNSFSQKPVYYKYYNEKSYSVVVFDDVNYEHTHRLEIYDENTKKDSVLLVKTYGYFNTNSEKITKNGYKTIYNSFGKKINTTYYILGDQHGDDPENIGAGHFIGSKIKKIPLFEYTSIKKNSGFDNEYFRIFAEKRLVNRPTIEKGYTYNIYKNKFLHNDTKDLKNKYLNWWLPNLLYRKDTTHKIVKGLDFTIDFTPQNDGDDTPLQVMLGNGPDGYYYMYIDDEGTTYLGVDNKKGRRNVLYVSKATKIIWGQKNHLRLQVLANGEYYIEINDYKESLQNLEYEQKLNGTNINLLLGNMLGMSNRIQAATTMDIHYIALHQLELVDTKKETHPYNAMHKDYLHFLTKRIVSTLFAQDTNQQLKKTNIYLTGFKEKDNENVLGVMCEISFYNKLEKKESSRPMLLEYIMDPESNDIKQVNIRFNTKNTFTFSAEKISKEVFKSQSNKNYYLRKGMLHHPNSR